MTPTGTGAGELGSYRSVLFGILRVIGTEPMAWTALGMLRGSPDPRRLLLCAAMNAAAIAQLARRLKTHPESLDDPRWVRRQSLIASLRFLLYPAISPRRTYWRRPANDAAFVLQTWTPIALHGAGRGSRSALAVGSIYTPATYLAAAILNGEFPLFPREAKQPVLAYSIGSVVAGIFTANVGATLRAARTDALAEQQLQHEVSRARAEQEIAQIAFDTWKESLADIQQAVVRQLRPADALQLLRELDAELSPDLGTSVTARGTVEDVVSRAADDHAISVELNTTGPIECTLPSLQAVYLVTQSALSNVRRHSGTSAARVTYQAATDSITLTIEDAGSGPAASRKTFNEHHALGHTQEYLRGLDGTITIGQGAGGGTTVSATWRTQ